ncbi:MAG TPA: SDR family oxidoreductase [Jatrophihabitantaceae bacterium]|jgi:NAD(P)-dependent dehydrogenase (short-subunit alcohol dehydrogenase family)
MSRFNRQTVVITGAGSGIGRALAYDLAQRGAVLAVSDVDELGLAETVDHVKQLGARVRGDRLDVTDRDAVLAYADSVADEFGAVHVVINNAGIAFTGDIAEMTFDDIERVMAVDFWGVVNGTKAFLPHVIASGDGTVVNISSLFGLMAVPSQGAYNAAKFAVRGFTEALRQEMLVADHPVRVTCVHPGGIKTAIARNAGAVPGRDAAQLGEFFDKRLAKTSAERAARTILNAAEKGHARVLVGADARFLDAYVRLVGSAYQRIGAAFTKRFAPKAKA